MTAPRWEQVDADNYRCTVCGASFPTGGVCSCPAVESAPESLSSPADADALSTADGCRAEMGSLYRACKAVARAMRKETNPREVSKLSAVSKALEVTRKVLDSAYAMARDREELDTLERYERMERKLAAAQAAGRRAHTEVSAN